MSGFKASASNPLKLRTLSTLGQFLNRHKLLQSHLKFFFNHRKFENFETCKDWYFVSLREEIWLLSRRAVVIDPSRAVCQENHISHRPLAIPKVQEAYFITQKSVRKKKKKRKKKTPRLSFVEFSLTRTGLNHTRLLKSSDRYAVERVLVEKDFMPHGVYIKVKCMCAREGLRVELH